MLHLKTLVKDDFINYSFYVRDKEHSGTPKDFEDQTLEALVHKLSQTEKDLVITWQ